jgi:hypothetical protein
MPTTTQGAYTQRCRCGTRIRPKQGYACAWEDEHGDRWCGNGEAHRPGPTCPPSAVVDQIIPSADVRIGDLVLWDGELRQVTGTHVFQPTMQPMIGVDGEPSTIPCGTYVAVRRYQEG